MLAKTRDFQILPFEKFKRYPIYYLLLVIENFFKRNNSQEIDKDFCKAQTSVFILTQFLPPTSFLQEIANQFQIPEQDLNLINSLKKFAIDDYSAAIIKYAVFAYINDSLTNSTSPQKMAEGMSQLFKVDIDGNTLKQGLVTASKYVVMPKELSEETQDSVMGISISGGMAAGIFGGLYVAAAVGASVGVGFLIGTGVGCIIGILIAFAILKAVDMHYNSLRNTERSKLEGGCHNNSEMGPLKAITSLTTQPKIASN
jgi:uncharacterized membrane protein YdfJ with MMPL/SSD domain